MKKISAFIDESGDPHFNNDSSTRIEYSAILVESDNVDEYIQIIEKIKLKYGISELKSRKIKKENRRINILKEILDIDFKFINLSIDKSKVLGDWKNYPKVFYKYTQNILHRELHRLYESKTVTIDKYGTEDYQKSLKKYLESNLQLNLFENILTIGSAKNNNLIQLADFIAGTHRKLLNGEFEKSDIIADLLKKKELHILIWPDNFNKFILKNISNNQDREIAEIAISYAERYIERYKSFPAYHSKIITLEYLLFHVKFVDYTKYLYSNELIGWLKQNDINYTEEEFRKEVIGHLRDDGVIIASSRKGLKIPMSVTELVDYLNYTTGRYLTIIKRFKETYKTLNAMSFGKLEIFNTEEFRIHKEIFKLLDKY